PEYFAPLELSLIGKARNQKLIDFEAINLRDFTHDNHHTVDDTPYGGGAGMVMKPEPWGEALDSVIAESSTRSVDLIILTPAGKKFTQRTAEEMANKEHLIFACGRYEGSP
ncbi:MAG: tRNA ((37)-N1)-methyltransferase TrmD, partial [Actinomycetota bacterium]